MLDRRQRPSWSARPQSAVEDASAAETRTRIQPRPAAALLLTAAGIVWALVRGLEFYGLGFVHLGYDLDQPPLLLVFVAMWLIYRNRRR